jgi:hypothetical protein
MPLQFVSTRFLAACAVLLTAGCAMVNDTSLRMVSTKVDAYLLVNKQWLTGDVLLIPNRTGRASFTATQGDITRCSGSMRYTGSYTADLDLHCNDGTQVTLDAQLQGETRGYGYGATAQGPASIAFGMDEDEAHAFMGRLPQSEAKPEAPAPTP